MEDKTNNLVWNLNVMCILHYFCHFISKYLKENAGQNSEIIRLEEE